MNPSVLPRRTFLKLSGAGLGLAALPAAAPRLAAAEDAVPPKIEVPPGLMAAVAGYVHASPTAPLPPAVVVKAKLHILDTFAAMISGAEFKVGKLSRDFARGLGGAQQAQVAGDTFLTDVINAALANGNLAHADETDDSHEPSGTHPGCAIIPAALAAAEKENISGAAFIASVVVGYDIGCRINQAFGTQQLNARNFATHAIGGCFGAAAAAASAMRLDDLKIRYTFDYVGQQASGMRYYVRDLEHVEKAFVFGGLPARSGAMAAMMAQAGFTGVDDCFSGESNLFTTFTANPNPAKLMEKLGEHFEISVTNIKKYSVGSPIQASVEALTKIIARAKFKPSDVKAFESRLPGYEVVNNRSMPDINIQYCLAATMLDGTLSFAAAHDFPRMNSPEILAMKAKLTMIADPSLRLPNTTRTARVTVTLNDGTTHTEQVNAVPGTAQNPMTVAQVEAKCRDILTPTMGAARADQLIAMVGRLEELKSVRELRPLLAKLA